MQRAVVTIGVFVVVAMLGTSARAQRLPDRTERVVATARVWAKVKFFHPHLAYKDVDWDAAFVATLPKVEAATSIAAYRAAIDAMLATLQDPVTRVAPARPPHVPARPGDWLFVDRDVVTIDLAVFTTGGWDYLAYDRKGEDAIAALAKARGAVIDLRATQPWLVTNAVEAFLDGLPAVPQWPEARHLEHHGFATQDGQTSGGYETVFVTTGGRAATPAPARGPAHVVFLADETTSIPPVAVGLQAAGRATILASSPLAEERSVLTATVDAGGGVIARVRLAEPLWGPPSADVIAAGDLRAQGIALARRAPPKLRPRVTASLPPYRLRVDADYAAAPFPSRALRVLAGVRIWATLAYFNPYQYLVVNWERAFRDALRRLDAATDVKTYGDALRTFATSAGDGHITISQAKRPPRSGVDVVLRIIEGKVAITELGPGIEGVAIGDVIEAIDGVPIDRVILVRRALVSGSTVEARDQRIAWLLLVGEPGTQVALRVRGARGPARTVTFTRTVFAPPAASAAPVWKTLADNIGYVDLRQLVPADVDPMLNDLAKTKAIVFDMRGYPKGTAWRLAPRFNLRNAVFGAQFLQPLVSHGEEASAGNSRRFFQPIDKMPTGFQPYRGKVVVLIDDRAISQAEHTCLFLREAAGAVFVGSATHGANGDITTLRLPGGLRMTFTGQEVRHVDGRQLQKIGIRPDVEVRPTLGGLRAAKDEVLDRALAWIATGR